MKWFMQWKICLLSTFFKILFACWTSPSDLWFCWLLRISLAPPRHLCATKKHHGVIASRHIAMPLPSTFIVTKKLVIFMILLTKLALNQNKFIVSYDTFFPDIIQKGSHRARFVVQSSYSKWGWKIGIALFISLALILFVSHWPKTL